MLLIVFFATVCISEMVQYCTKLAFKLTYVVIQGSNL
jgi:hypothetical protein